MKVSLRSLIAVSFGVAVCSAATVSAAGAQSAQPWSIQASVLGADLNINGDVIGGVGVEAMFRYTPASSWSIGVGYQYTHHTKGSDALDLSGGFIEPRYAIDIGSDRFAPYIAGRLAVLNESSDFPGLGTFSSAGLAFGVGAGLLIKASTRVNIDIGAAIVEQSFSDAHTGNSTITFPSFTGYILKAGVSFGFGG